MEEGERQMREELGLDKEPDSRAVAIFRELFGESSLELQVDECFLPSNDGEWGLAYVSYQGDELTVGYGTAIGTDVMPTQLIRDLLDMIDMHAKLTALGYAASLNVAGEIYEYVFTKPVTIEALRNALLVIQGLFKIPKKE